ncbi:hypothetical protein B0T10DRAFT_467128 [Thelonectria olida]|uniref:Secreted protein n=1 Tax=Thelonectria olida TaxID=1576542 RepID=A0A9P8VS77_9HYPO|nr:hypothetical protein B0T10DRAFT_467128 [Thelonectria olida]
MCIARLRCSLLALVDAQEDAEARGQYPSPGLVSRNEKQKPARNRKHNAAGTTTRRASAKCWLKMKPTTSWVKASQSHAPAIDLWQNVGQSKSSPQSEHFKYGGRLDVGLV